MTNGSPANTGERILPEKESPLMIARHLKAYKFAADFVKDKTVLDIGCGAGYGSAFLSGTAREVTGLDYSGPVIEYASCTYPRDNLKFICLDIRDLSSHRARYDAACSFQVIEHLHDATAFIMAVRQLLNDDGLFICSTPDKDDASPNSSVPLNRFHVKEYLREEFRELFIPYFKSVELFFVTRGGRLNFYRRLKKSGLCNALPKRINPVTRYFSSVDCGEFNVSKDALGQTLDFIAVCRK